MAFSTALTTILERLESLLNREFSGKGKDLAERVESADIPQELRGHLRKIVRLASSTGDDQDPARLLELAFLCGQTHEQLEALAVIRLVEPFNYVQPDGNPGPEIDDADIANVAAFASAWNQFMRKIADFVLKLLLVMVVVVLVGLLIGVI